MTNCPCGSGSAYSDCCEPIIKGLKPAETAEKLMRARYSAYAGVEMDFVFETTHPDQRGDYDHEGTREWAESSDWQGLEIISTKDGGKNDITGEVEFIARFRHKEAPCEHHELANFKRENGLWLFTDGTMVKQKPIIANKVGRNDPCTCGSGLKYKKCCGK